MKHILIISALIISLSACNKDEKAANKLEGTWNATSLFHSDSEQIDSDYNLISEENRTITFEFIKCDIKKGKDCECHYQTVDFEGYVGDLSFVYTISEKGTELFLDNTEDIYDQTWTITKLENETLEMNKSNPNGSQVTMILTKV